VSSGENNIFTSMQEDIKYEGCIDEGRTYLAAGRYNKAIEAANRAREYLREGADTSEIDEIVGAAQSALERIEQDRRELAEREERERARAAEQERLAREQAEQRARQAREQAEQRARQAAQDEQRRSKLAQEEERMRARSKGLAWFFAATVLLIVDYFFIVSLSSSWHGEQNTEAALLAGAATAIGASIYMIIAERVSEKIPNGNVLLWIIFIPFVMTLVIALLDSDYGAVVMPAVVIGLMAPFAAFVWRKMTK